MLPHAAVGQSNDYEITSTGTASKFYHFFTVWSGKSRQAQKMETVHGSVFFARSFRSHARFCFVSRLTNASFDALNNMRTAASMRSASPEALFQTHIAPGALRHYYDVLSECFGPQCFGIDLEAVWEVGVRDLPELKKKVLEIKGPPPTTGDAS
jgi:hypothetical protein